MENLNQKELESKNNRYKMTEFQKKALLLHPNFDIIFQEEDAQREIIFQSEENLLMLRILIEKLKEQQPLITSNSGEISAVFEKRAQIATLFIYSAAVLIKSGTLSQPIIQEFYSQLLEEELKQITIYSKEILQVFKKILNQIEKENGN